MFEDVYVDVTRAGGASPAESWTHRIRSLVTTGPGGRPESHVLIVQDVTAQFEAEMRFERTFAANPAPAVICRLADLRYVRLNEGFSELTGFDADAVIGRTLYEVDVLAAPSSGNWRSRGSRRAAPSRRGGAPARAGGGERAVIVAGQPIEIADDPCMLFTFADLEPRRAAETALRASEERFETAFRLAPVPMLVARCDGFGSSALNQRSRRRFGHGPEALGRAPGDLGLWVDEGARAAFERDLLQTGRIAGAETCLRPRRAASATASSRPRR